MRNGHLHIVTWIDQQEDDSDDDVDSFVRSLAEHVMMQSDVRHLSILKLQLCDALQTTFSSSSILKSVTDFFWKYKL